MKNVSRFTALALVLLLLVSLCGGTTIRIAPPLIINKNDINMFAAELATALKSV